MSLISPACLVSLCESSSLERAGQGGEYSPITDGYALGITLLVILTGRSPLALIHKCEEEFEEDFVDIAAGIHQGSNQAHARTSIHPPSY